MSSKETDELFEVIQSLSSAERRYFKVYFERNAYGEATKYIRVYDALASMNEFDKTKLQEKLKGEKTVEYYSKTKAYLLDAIFTAMRSYRAGNATREDIYSTIQTIHFLLDKNLDDYALRLIHKTKALCYDIELLSVLIELIYLEESLLQQQIAPEQNSFDEVAHVMTLYNELLHLNRIDKQVYSLYKQFGVRPSEEAKSTITSIINELSSKSKSNLLLLGSRELRYSILSLCYHILGKYKEATDARAQGIHIAINAPEAYIQENAKRLVRSLGNLQSFAFQGRDYEFYKQTIDFVNEQLPKLTSNETLIYEIRITQLFCSISLTMDFTLFTKEVQFIEQNINQLRSIHVVRRGDTTFNIALGYFKTGKFNDAIRWLNELSTIPSIEQRADLAIHAKIFEILLHWKLNNLDVVQSKTLSFKRYLTKRDQLGEFEQAMIRFLNSAIKKKSTDDFPKAIESIRKQLATLDASKYAGIVAHYNDLLFWFEQPENNS